MDDSAPRTPQAPLRVGGLAGVLARGAPSCGAVRVVGVDGHAGSGKSTFAGLLADAAGGAPVVRLDDVATHEAYFGWTERLRAGLLEPLARGEDGELPVYDWPARRFGPAVRVPWAPLVVVEGVGAGRAALRQALSAVVWMDVEPQTAWARGRRRDGPGLEAFWERWTAAERAHFAADPTRPFADWTVTRRGDVHQVHAGPARAG